MRNLVTPERVGTSEIEPDLDTNAHCSVFYIGGQRGMERRIVTSESNLLYHAIPAAALRGRNPLALGRGLLTMMGGILAAHQLLRTLRPAAILGTGGYVCVPVFLAARFMGIPTLIYLPDVVPGLAVRFLARVATQVACTVEDARNHLHVPAAKIIITGYPVRPELFQQQKPACQEAFGLSADMPVLLVYGGSLGARAINRAVAALLPDLLALTQIIHICGREGDEVWLRAAAQRLDPGLQRRYRLYPYLERKHDPAPAVQHQVSSKQEGGVQTTTRDYQLHQVTPTMAQAFGAADLALCRSGASTLAELPAAGVPAILVPYPYVHQDENADYLVRHGAALKVADTAMIGAAAPSDGPLFQHLQRLLVGTENEERQRMAERCRTLAQPDAANRLAEALCNLATRSGSSCGRSNSFD